MQYGGHRTVNTRSEIADIIKFGCPVFLFGFWAKFDTNDLDYRERLMLSHLLGDSYPLSYFRDPPKFTPIQESQM